MDCKIVITCEKCKCKAELSQPTWMEANAYTCPNCRERMPADYWMLLKNAIGALSMVPNSCDGFSISVSESDLNLDNRTDEI